MPSKMSRYSGTAFSRALKHRLPVSDHITLGPIKKPDQVFGSHDCGVENSESTLAPRPAMPERAENHKKSRPYLGMFLFWPYAFFFSCYFLGGYPTSCLVYDTRSSSICIRTGTECMGLIPQDGWVSKMPTSDQSIKEQLSLLILHFPSMTVHRSLELKGIFLLV